jgi:hypothetical protein
MWTTFGRPVRRWPLGSTCRTSASLRRSSSTKTRPTAFTGYLTLEICVQRAEVWQTPSEEPSPRRKVMGLGMDSAGEIYGAGRHAGGARGAVEGLTCRPRFQDHVCTRTRGSKMAGLWRGELSLEAASDPYMRGAMHITHRGSQTRWEGEEGGLGWGGRGRPGDLGWLDLYSRWVGELPLLLSHPPTCIWPHRGGLGSSLSSMRRGLGQGRAGSWGVRSGHGGAGGGGGGVGGLAPSPRGEAPDTGLRRPRGRPSPPSQPCHCTTSPSAGGYAHLG